LGCNKKMKSSDVLILAVDCRTQAVKSMTRPGEQYLPDSNNANMYNQIFEKVYSKMYKRLHPLWRSSWAVMSVFVNPAFAASTYLYAL